jgi:glycosyltransferase involved in cell wall biosynthesis
MKILHAFSSFEMGGAQARFIQVYEQWPEGDEHIVIAMDNCFDAMDRIADRTRITTQPFAAKKGKFLNNIRSIRELLFTFKPDVLVSYNWGAIEWVLASIGLKIRSFHVEEGFSVMESNRRFFRRSFTRMLAFRLSQAKLIVVSSLMRHIALNEWKIPAAKILRISNGVDLPSANPSKAPEPPISFGEHHPQFIVGSVAVLRKEKRLDRLLSAFRLLDERFGLVIIGDGPEKTSLETLRDTYQLKDRVIFLGYQSAPQRFYPGFTLFASSSATEQLSLAILDAMAYGIPFVVTDVGDNKELAGEFAKQCISEPEPEALAESIRRLCEDPLLRNEISLVNKTRLAKSYTREGMLSEWVRTVRGPLGPPVQLQATPAIES